MTKGFNPKLESGKRALRSPQGKGVKGTLNPRQCEGFKSNKRLRKGGRLRKGKL